MRKISKSVTICYKFIHFGLLLHPHSHKLAIYFRKKCGQFKSGKFGPWTFLDFIQLYFFFCNDPNHKNTTPHLKKINLQMMTHPNGERKELEGGGDVKVIIVATVFRAA